MISPSDYRRTPRFGREAMSPHRRRLVGVATSSISWITEYGNLRASHPVVTNVGDGLRTARPGLVVAVSIAESKPTRRMVTPRG
jgi:hypothetical protein